VKDETLNMSIRKFLKTVGVNSQLAIEKAVHKAIADGKLKGNETIPLAMTLNVGKLELNVKFDGDLTLE
jgi:predicted transcriptional regulator